jgi:deoxyribodipyrimidine photo-lyase
MHNRLRMIVAMYLAKDLFIDWRHGESHFMRSLVDGDFANNNGGWQWSASTGCDAAPYFRVFNPVRQSERWDPEGRFIRRYCPELAGLDTKQVHAPSKLGADRLAELGYPQPMVNHRIAVSEVVTAFRRLGPIKR